MWQLSQEHAEKGVSTGCSTEDPLELQCDGEEERLNCSRHYLVFNYQPVLLGHIILTLTLRHHHPHVTQDLCRDLVTVAFLFTNNLLLKRYLGCFLHSTSTGRV